MPWCPNCKAEYQEGYTECSDCKLALVDDIHEEELLVPFFQAEEKKVAEKLARFFEYSDVNSSVSFDEENSLYVVSVSPHQQLQAKQLYMAFYEVERERLVQGHSELAKSNKPNKDDTSKEDFTDEDFEDSEAAENDYSTDTPSDEATAFDDLEEQSPAAYVMKEDQYKDLNGTVGVFLVTGIAGAVIVMLNVIGVLNFLSWWLPQAVMGVMFLAFIYVAVTTNQKAKKIKQEIATENALTKDINEWLANQVTENYLVSLHDDTISEELNYLKKMDSIKESLLKEFGPQNLSYLDRLIEEYYNETFDQI